MRIGRASRESGVAERLIRHYEELGLLGSITRTAGGYRDYEDDAVVRLRFIGLARQVGFAMDDISHVMQAWNEDDRRTMPPGWSEALAERRAVLDELEGLLKGS